jgi:cell division protein FtsB
MFRYATEAYYQKKIAKLEGKIEMLKEKIAQLESENYVNRDK